jgi:hypothetical protein
MTLVLPGVGCLPGRGKEFELGPEGKAGVYKTKKMEERKREGVGEGSEAAGDVEWQGTRTFLKMEPEMVGRQEGEAGLGREWGLVISPRWWGTTMTCRAPSPSPLRQPQFPPDDQSETPGS